MKKIILAYCLLFCATSLMTVKIVQAKDVIPEGIRPVCQDIKFMTTDAKHYTGAHNNNNYNYKFIASESFEYALMSSNIYKKYDSSNPEFKISGWKQEGDKKTNEKGFGAHVYKSTTGPKTKFIIAFEGQLLRLLLTEFSVI
jgi:hypothetical protein